MAKIPVIVSIETDGNLCGEDCVFMEADYADDRFFCRYFKKDLLFTTDLERCPECFDYEKETQEALNRSPNSPRPITPELADEMGRKGFKVSFIGLDASNSKGYLEFKEDRWFWSGNWECSFNGPIELSKKYPDLIWYVNN